MSLLNVGSICSINYFFVRFSDSTTQINMYTTKYERLIYLGTDFLYIITCIYTKRHKSMKIKGEKLKLFLKYWSDYMHSKFERN